MADARDGKTIHPVILSGGSGTRLWPLSRALYPKQFLALAGERTLLQEAVSRASGAGFAPPMVVCNQAHRFTVAEQLRGIEAASGAIVLEPEGRNTAPAAAVASLLAERDDPDGLVLVLPSDQVITETGVFRDAIALGARAAAAGRLVTFGIAPERAETGYGYIKEGAPLPGLDGCFEVARFTEKPDAGTAETYLSAGGYHWNGGIFLFSAGAFLAELGRLKPEMVAACRAAVDGATEDLDFLRLEAGAFAAMESVSIDYAVMEHTALAAVVPVDMGWSDVGSWEALWEMGDKDKDGNRLVGDVQVMDVKGAYLRSEGAMLAAIGLEDVVIVATDDAILAASRDRAQDVKALVEGLKARGRSEHAAHSRVFRPWGWYQSLEIGERFQVKLIELNPGARISLQRHAHRAEHWVVVNGTARVRRGDEELELRENQSTFIPVGTLHRLENGGAGALRIIEVQSGDYLGEDDIERFDDSYGRA